MIPFVDLKKINLEYEDLFHDSLADLMKSGWVLLGKHLQSFEENFAKYCGTKYCVGVGNGLEAITVILEGYKIAGKLNPGDEVIVPANTYIATILGVKNAGMVPVLVEPDPNTMNLNPEKVREAVNSKTKAIFTVHLYGQLSPVKELRSICDEHNLYLFDDVAQAHGAKYSDDDLPSNFVDASAYSFYPSKNLGAIGDGGAVTVNDTEIYEFVKAYRNYGSKKKYENEFAGVNSRLDELQAAFLNHKLPNLDRDNERRRTVAKRYLEGINNPQITLPSYSGGTDHVFHVFVVRTSRRQEFVDFLTENEIQTVIHYPIPPHKQKALPEYHGMNLPITTSIHEEVVSLPISPVISDEEVEKVIQAVNNFN